MHSVNIIHFPEYIIGAVFERVRQYHVLIEQIIKSGLLIIPIRDISEDFLTYKFCALTRFISEKKKNPLSNLLLPQFLCQVWRVD